MTVLQNYLARSCSSYCHCSGFKSLRSCSVVRKRDALVVGVPQSYGKGHEMVRTTCTSTLLPLPPSNFPNHSDPTNNHSGRQWLLQPEGVQIRWESLSPKSAAVVQQREVHLPVHLSSILCSLPVTTIWWKEVCFCPLNTVRWGLTLNWIMNSFSLPFIFCKLQFVLLLFLFFTSQGNGWKCCFYSLLV